MTQTEAIDEDAATAIVEFADTLLENLGQALDAASVRMLSRTPAVTTLRRWDKLDTEVGPPGAPIEEYLAGWLATSGAETSRLATATIGDWSLLLEPVPGLPDQQVVVALRHGEPFAGDEIATFELLVRMLTAQSMAESETAVLQSRLDDLVTRTATELMAVSASTLDAALQVSIRELCEFFSVDTAFLRRNDQSLEASVLMCEWPIRVDVPDPDPLGIVPWAAPDPVFAAIKDLSETLLIRPDKQSADYQERVRAGSGVQQVSLAMVPLINNELTVGVLGFIRFGDRNWVKPELNALRAIASLLTQLMARVEAEAELQYTAYHDELTGLPNRRAFFEYLTERVSHEHNPPLALLFFDMDRLKAMNDFLGHAAGDRLICEVGSRLVANASNKEFVARLGGDEFVVVIPDCRDEAKALEVAHVLLTALTEQMDVGDQPISRSASVGVAVGIPGRSTASEMLLHADVALLEAKAHGGNEVVAFNDAMRDKIQWRADLELHLRSAIHNDELRLFYQPEIDLRDGKLLSFEALVRWQHATRGMLMPDTFIDIVEETNLAADLGRWVINEACSQLAQWRARYDVDDIEMRINVSPAQLISHDIVGVVAGCLSRYDLPASAICLEITERLVVRDLDRALAIMKDLRQLGVSFAIDDFGTGYSSFAQLKALPVDTLKIDRSFVNGLGRDLGDRAIVESIARLADAFGMNLVAEGVETATMATELLGLGVIRAQGFLISRAQPPEVLEHMIERGSVDLVELGLTVTAVAS
jgi:diguanylate cyclase (GGDEF)-like protein